jgi:hypothetical protein
VAREKRWARSQGHTEISPAKTYKCQQTGLVQTCIGIALLLYTVTKSKGHPMGCLNGTGRGRLKIIPLPYTTLVPVGTGGQRHSLTTLPQENQPIPETAGWNSGSVWTGRKNYSPTGVKTPDFPMRWEVRVVNRAYIFHAFWNKQRETF